MSWWWCHRYDVMGLWCRGLMTPSCVFEAMFSGHLCFSWVCLLRNDVGLMMSCLWCHLYDVISIIIGVLCFVGDVQNLRYFLHVLYRQDLWRLSHATWWALVFVSQATEPWGTRDTGNRRVWGANTGPSAFVGSMCCMWHCINKTQVRNLQLKAFYSYRGRPMHVENFYCIFCHTVHIDMN